VIVLPSGDRGEQLLNVVEEWVRSRLLSPAIWVRGQDVKSENGASATTHDGRPPRVRGTIIGRNDRADVDLFRELGQVELTTLRFVVIRWVEGTSIGGSNGPVDQVQDAAVEVLEKYLDFSRPQVTDGGSQMVGTNLIRLNLIFAPSEHAVSDVTHLIRQAWESNVVVAPEDRKSAAAFDGFTRTEDQDTMNRFILANTATASGLWSGVQASVYELDRVKQIPTALSRIVIQRSFVRGILTGGLAVRMAARALTQAIRPDAIVRDRKSKLKYMAPSLVPMRIQLMLDIAMLMSDGLLSYRDYTDFVEPAKQKRGLLSAIWDFAKFCWDKVKALPGWFIEFQLKKLSSAISRRLYGSDGDTEIDASIDFGASRSILDRRLALRVKRISDQQKQLAELLDKPLAVAVQDEHPQLWKDLRSLVFQSLDGRVDGAGTGRPSVVDLSLIQALTDEPEVPFWTRIIAGLKNFWLSIFSKNEVVQPKLAVKEKPRVPSLTDEGIDENHNVKVVGNIALICPDPADTWLPNPEIVSLVGRDVSSRSKGAWMDTLAAREWQSILRQRIDSLQGHVSRYNRLLSTMQSELTSESFGIEDEIREVELQLGILNSRREALAMEISYLGTVEPTVDEDEEADSDVATQALNPPLPAVPENTLFARLKAFFMRVFSRKRNRSTPPPPAPPTGDELFALAQNSVLASADRMASPQYREEIGNEYTQTVENIGKLQELRRHLDVRLRGSAGRESNTEELEESDLENLRLLEEEELRVSEWISDREMSFACLLNQRLNEQYARMDARRNQVEQFTRQNYDVELEGLQNLAEQFTKHFKWRSFLPALAGILLCWNPVGWVLLAAVVPGFFWALVSYHREWSQVGHRLNRAEHQLNYATLLVPHVSREQARLTMLHAQVAGHLEVVAETLYRPWIVSEDLLVDKYDGDIQADSLPTMFDVASVPLNEESKENRDVLQNIVDEVIRRPGWRHDEYRHLVNDMIGEEDAFYADRREGALYSLKESIKSQEILRRNGAQRVEDLETEVRLELLSGSSRPRVVPIRRDPLQGLEVDPTIDLGLGTQGFEWDQYLLEIMNTPTAWGGLTTSDSGVWVDHEKLLSGIDSYVFGPTRLKDHVTAQLAAYTPTTGTEESGVVPVEFAVRVDLSRRLPPEWTHLMKDAVAEMF